MKDFNEFVSSLSADVMNELDRKALEQANEMFEKHKDEFEPRTHHAMHERYFNTYMTIALLEKYHEWLSQ